MDQVKLSGTDIDKMESKKFDGIGLIKFNGKNYNLDKKGTTVNDDGFEDFKKILADFCRQHYIEKSKEAMDKFLIKGSIEGGQYEKRIKLLKILYPE